jgi:hypothetical protein
MKESLVDPHSILRNGPPIKARELLYLLQNAQGCLRPTIDPAFDPLSISQMHDVYPSQHQNVHQIAKSSVFQIQTMNPFLSITDLYKVETGHLMLPIRTPTLKTRFYAISHLLELHFPVLDSSIIQEQNGLHPFDSLFNGL